MLYFTLLNAVVLTVLTLLSDLMSPRHDLGQLDRAATTGRLVWSLASYVTVWLAEDSTSLQTVFSACSSVLQYCTALLLRPGLLASLLAGAGSQETDTRDRRLVYWKNLRTVCRVTPSRWPSAPPLSW